MNLKFLTNLFFFVIICYCSLFAANVEEVSTYSNAMQKEIKAIVITPDTYTDARHYPVLYLLHGYSDNYSSWIDKVPKIKDYVDQYHLIIVCPDGNYSSWYMDSPVDSTFRYETYVARELTEWVDKHYHTVASREGRAITGLSMGGHGALFLAFRNQDVYGAAGSMSGGVDLRPFPENWELKKRLGTYAEYPENWEANSVINLVYRLVPNALRISIECGVSDFFYRVNCNLHEKLLERNIPHDFTVRPGAHNWQYWGNAIGYQVLFFSDFFHENKDQ